MRFETIDGDPGMGFGSLDAYSLVALGVGAIIAGVWAMSRGYGRDPLVALVTWCRGRGMEFEEPPEGADVVGTFRGQMGGSEVTIEVRRLPDRKLADLPPQLTTISVTAPGVARRVLLQPADWVMDVEGGSLPAPVRTGDTTFDDLWHVYAEDPMAVPRLITAGVRRRLMAADTALLSLRLGDGRVGTSHPGIVSEDAELERRVGVVSDVARLLAEEITANSSVVGLRMKSLGRAMRRVTTCSLPRAYARRTFNTLSYTYYVRRMSARDQEW